MIDIIETQKRWGRESCFRMAKLMSNAHGVFSDSPHMSDITRRMIDLINDINPGVLDKDGPCFWKYLTWVKAIPVAITCDRCGALRMHKLKFGNPPVLCKKCGSIQVSATRQGISLEEWDGYATEQKYCSKFNESLKRAIREKYDNKCFLCGKPQSDNITIAGKQKALSVHHVDMNKDQGCDEHDWSLVPLCMEHHPQAHSDMWQARIEYLLDNVWE